MCVRLQFQIDDKIFLGTQSTLKAGKQTIQQTNLSKMAIFIYISYLKN